jgi:uncharacterized membrane protein YeaQ/YmgE (transglycosylase-associated protein family)
MSNEPDHLTNDSYIDDGAGPTVAPVYPTGDVATRVTNVRHVEGVAPTHSSLGPTPISHLHVTPSWPPIAGVTFLVVGLMAMIRAGFKGPLDVPVVKVVGFTHTAILGIVEAVIGACLLIAGASRSRGAAMSVGTILAVGAFVGAVQTKSFVKALALQKNSAWLVCIVGAVVVLTALVLPRLRTRSTTVVAN